MGRTLAFPRRYPHDEHVKLCYSTPSGTRQEYVCQSEDAVILSDVMEVFLRDLDLCIEEVEAALRTRGVSVSRPASGQQ